MIQKSAKAFHGYWHRQTEQRGGICRKLSILTACSLLLTPIALPARAQSDADRAEQCRQAVLNCQLRDGAIVEVAYRELGSPALVEPYFSNLACCGILAAEQMKPDPRNRQFILKWLKWYANQEKMDGKIGVLSGTRGPNGLTGATILPPDSQDSYAALYLYVAGRYSKLTNTKLDPDVAAACVRLLGILKGCQSGNGFYWNFPEATTPQGHPHAEDLNDNVEVYMGLSEISQPLETAGFSTESQQAQGAADELARNLAQYWSSKYYYYVCIFSDIAADVPFGTQPPKAAGLAMLAALAMFDNVPDYLHRCLWERLQINYGSQLQIGYNSSIYSDEDPTIETSYRAALRSASDEELEVQHRMLQKRVDEFLARNNRLGDKQALEDKQPFPYCHRFGMMLIALSSPRGKASPYLPAVPLPLTPKIF